MKIKKHKIKEAISIMRRCYASTAPEKRLLGKGIEICLGTLEIDIEKAPGAGKHSGTRKNNTPLL